MNASTRLMLACVVAGLLTSMPQLVHGQPRRPQGPRTPTPVAPLRPPSEASIPDGPLGEAIRQGERILTQTPVYAKAYVGARLNCTSCHLDRGRQAWAAPWAGIWGPHAFNIGAGMARLDTAAAFVKAKMPLGQGETLSAQEAYDVAAYFTREPRPDFPPKDRDWPKGNKPADARY